LFLSLVFSYIAVGFGVLVSFLPVDFLGGDNATSKRYGLGRELQTWTAYEVEAEAPEEQLFIYSFVDLEIARRIKPQVITEYSGLVGI